MTLEVFTARIGTRDPDALDVTRGSGQGDALAFAPSQELLNRALAARRLAQRKREEAETIARGGAAGLLREADEIEEAAWKAYEPRFVAEMRVSYGAPPAKHGPLEREAVGRGVRPLRRAWEALLARRRVVLECYCTDPDRCHRRLVAGILAKLGAVDRGEIAPGPPAQLPLIEPGPAGIARRDLKPEEIAAARGELGAVVVGLRAWVDGWSDIYTPV